MKKLIIALTILGFAATTQAGTALTNLNVTITRDTNVIGVLSRARERMDPNHAKGNNLKQWGIFEVSTAMTNRLRAIYIEQLQYEREMEALAKSEQDRLEAIAADAAVVTD